ncbi:MAG TPA: hypothetical protein VES69_03430, partial [Pyrinomonadaceae bacterium]|nr:hypothetical protein [Pyrinomonadaceae bacterium]
ALRSNIKSSLSDRMLLNDHPAWAKMALLLHGLFRYGFAAGCEAAAPPRRSGGFLNRALPLVRLENGEP